MSTTRKSHPPQRRRKVLRKPRQQATAPSHIASDNNTPVWGAKSIGAIIGRSERQAFHLLESKALKGAKKINGMWSAIPSLLRAQWETEGDA